MLSPISSRLVSPPTKYSAPKTKFSSTSSQLIKGFTQGSPLLKALDYTIVGDTLIRQSMLIYACIIGSRVVMARTNNERLEVLRRDPLGWYMWFMGKPLFGWGILYLATIKDPQVRALLLNYQRPKNAWESINTIINPPGQYFSSTEKQLGQRYQQLKSILLRQSTGVKKIRQLTQVFNRANNLLVLTSFSSLVLTILGLGIGINVINIALTRRNVEREKRNQALRNQVDTIGAQNPALSSQIARLQMQQQPPIVMG